jgi:Protein tyrosine and serine/threonine kinase
MMANVFDLENRFYHENGDEDRRNLVVLTTVTQKFKQILYTKYQVEFQRYLKLKHSHHPSTTNETIFCDLRVHNGSHYTENFSDFSTCLREMKRRCSNYTNVDINSYCTSIKIATTNTTTFNMQLVFNSEHLNLFDFVTSMLSRDNSSSSLNRGNQQRNYQFDFIVLDFKSILNDTTTFWRPLLILEQNEFDRKLFTMHHTLLENSTIDWLPPILWKCETVCWSVIIASISIVIILIIILSLFLGVAARNYFLRKRLSKGPNKVVLASSDFVFPIDSRRVDEGIEAMLCCWLQTLGELGPEVSSAVEKPDLLKGSIGSLKNLGLPGISTTNKSNSTSGSLVKPANNTNMVEFKPRYQGDLVQLKEIINPSGSSIELRTKAMDLLITAHSLRHENINPLIGFLSDPNRTALVFEYCSRGSLQDVLIMDEIKLDWSFRLSLLTDLVRGMRYLHSR